MSEAVNRKLLEKLLKKSIKLWADKLRGPYKFDDGDKSNIGAMTQMWAVMANVDDVKKDDVDKFETMLFDRLIKEESAYVQRSLNTDYHPNEHLAEAAKACGISEGRFPVKSNTQIDYSGMCVSESFGYGAKTIYHYPIEEGWFVTSIYGDAEDIKKLVEATRKGHLDFKIEK